MAETVDMDRFRLRRFAVQLEAAGELERVSGTPFSGIAARLDGNPKAVLFDQLPNCPFDLIGGVLGSRKRIALALGVEPDALGNEIWRRSENHGQVQIVEVSRRDAPVQQVVQSAGEVDLTQLPIHVQHGLDGGPYISAGLDFSVDPVSGRANVGVRRFMLRSRNTTSIDLTIGSHLRQMYRAALGRGERLSLSVVVGSYPTDYVAGGMSAAGDELELMSALRGGPLPLVKSISSNIRVPADAEWVLEGYLGEEGYCSDEGPYGEGFGYYGGINQDPIFHVTAVTRRRDALFQTILFSGRHFGRTESAPMASVKTEALLWRALKMAIREPVAVHVTSSSMGVFNARIAIRQRIRGEARNAIAAAFAVGILKNVFVVDSDVDITSDAEMDWALATRFQPHRDLVVQGGFRTIVLDPSLNGEPLGSKAGYDLTFPFGETDRISLTLAEPPRFEGRRFASLRAALEDGPKSFVELVVACGSDDGREVAPLLDALRDDGVLGRDERSGKYLLKKR